MIVGAYTVHLYCDDDEHRGWLSETGYHVFDPDKNRYVDIQHEFAAQNERGCLKEARHVGWTFNKYREAFCPICSKRTKASD